MNRKSGSHSGVFLMEMMVAIFFFILCASTCILAFVKSNNLSALASDRNRAVTVAESVAEIWKLEGMDGLAEQLPVNVLEGESAIYFDRNWKPLTSAQENLSETVYAVRIAEEYMENGQEKLFISVEKGKQSDTALFELEVSRYGRP